MTNDNYKFNVVFTDWSLLFISTRNFYIIKPLCTSPAVPLHCPLHFQNTGITYTSTDKKFATFVWLQTFLILPIHYILSIQIPLCDFPRAEIAFHQALLLVFQRAFVQ